MATNPNAIGASAGLPPSAQASAPNPTPPNPVNTPASTTQTPAPSAPQTISAPPPPPLPYYDFDVAMTCGSCSGAVTRVLGKLIAEPNKFNVDLPFKKVYVWGPSLPPFDEVEKKIAKTGKKTEGREVTSG